MTILNVEVVAELGEKIEKAAKERLVTPEYMINCILACHFADRKKASWLSPKIVEALRDGLAAALIAINREDRQEKK
jgi:hypothetical protein